MAVIYNGETLQAEKSLVKRWQTFLTRQRSVKDPLHHGQIRQKLDVRFHCDLGEERIVTV